MREEEGTLLGFGEELASWMHTQSSPQGPACTSRVWKEGGGYWLEVAPKWEEEPPQAQKSLLSRR